MNKPKNLKQRQELFNNNLKLISIFTKSLSPLARSRNIDPEDLWQVGAMSWWRGTEHYNSTKGAVSTYMYTYVRRAMLKHIYALKQNVLSSYSEMDSVEEPYAEAAQEHVLRYKEVKKELLKTCKNKDHTTIIIEKLKGTRVTDFYKNTSLCRSACSHVWLNALKHINKEL